MRLPRLAAQVSLLNSDLSAAAAAAFDSLEVAADIVECHVLTTTQISVAAGVRLLIVLRRDGLWSSCVGSLLPS